MGKKSIASEKIDIDGENCFFLVTVTAYKGKIPFKKIQAYVGNLKNSLIFSDEKRDENEALAGQRLFNNSVRLLKEYALNPFETSVCLYDKKGIYCEKAEKLLPFASVLHIICPEKERYRECTEKMLYNYGVSVSVSEKWNQSADLCNNVIASDSEILPLSYKGRAFVLKERVLPDTVFVVGKGIELPYKYERLRPFGVDKTVFASALYEKCGITEAENWPYEKLAYY